MMMDYELFKKEVFRITKIDLSSYKERQMKRRIDTLINKKGYKGYEDFVKGLRTDEQLLHDFLGHLTINVSEFFRNIEQWELLEKDVLPYLIKNFGKKINIWSAACSTGDEPYSLAMVLSKHIPLSQINIMATDIDDEILKKAKAGIYTSRSVAAVPKEFLNKYFTQENGKYIVSDEIKKCINFKKHNLLKDPYPSNMHLIVCRNVLIYFTDEAKDDIFTKFSKSLNKGGMLFIGSTEQIFKPDKYNLNSSKSFYYEKME